MKFTIIIFLVLFFTTPCFGQAIEKNTSLFDEKNQSTFNKETYRYPSLNERISSTQYISIGNKSYLNKSDTQQPLNSNNVEMKIKLPKYYEGPKEAKFSDSTNPYTNDYGYYKSTNISDKSWISTSSTHNTYLTVGSSSNIKASYNYVINNRLGISAGSYISQYNIDRSLNSDMGVNAAIRYRISNRISINAFGQYSGFAKKNGVDAADRWNMISTTHYGGALEYKITDSFGVIGGMMRELNPMTGKWKNVPFIAPVFYNK